VTFSPVDRRGLLRILGRVGSGVMGGGGGNPGKVGFARRKVRRKDTSESSERHQSKKGRFT